MSEKVLYWDCVGGVAGDMLLASLFDLGASVDRVRSTLADLGLDDVQLELVEVKPAGLRAARVDMMVRGQLADSGEAWNPATMPAGSGHHPYRAIRDRLASARLPDPVRETAQRTFHILAEAEGRVHGIDPETVEFHEVGADDALADIVGVSTALVDLAIQRVVASPLPLGRGLVRGAHGPIPLPAPATLAVLEGCPIVETDLEGESVTPTGAALLRAVVERFGPMPSFELAGVGVGAGHRSWPDRPNIVRAILGRAASSRGTRDDECIVEANLDDIHGAHLPVLLEALLAAGAVDAWAEPILAKKGRPGHQVGALVRRAARPAVVDAFFRHSPTLGVRFFDVERELSPRELVTVDTRFGPVRVKVSPRPGGSELRVPEFEDCRARADAHGVSVREVFDAAAVAASARASRPDES